MRRLILALCLAVSAPVAAAGVTPFKLGLILGNPQEELGGDFGHAVAAAGPHLLIGAPVNDSYRGVVYLYDGTDGGLLHSFPNPPPARHEAGWSVAATGNTLIVGEPSLPGGLCCGTEGAVHLFDAASGQLLRTITEPTPDFGGFGLSVAGITGNVLTGAPGDRFFPGFGRGGVAYLFDGTSGAVLRTLDNPSPDAGDAFGATVATADTVLVVAAPHDDTGGADAGAVYAFDATSGALLRAFHNPDATSTRHFGAALAAAGTKVLIGAPDLDRRRGGAAYLFDVAKGQLLRRFTNPTHGTGDLFASAVALLGSHVAVGAPNASPDAVFVFDAESGALLRILTYPLTPPADVFPVFGSSLASVGDALLVGALNGEGGKAFLFVEACGDGEVATGERCDDGNRVAGDGCAADCRLESCGDAAVVAGEDCDDGNRLDGDGCDVNCTSTGCGNGIVTAGEECDDGNLLNGDGCDGNCTLSTCGNGAVANYETCDDRNTLGGDGCSAWCGAERCGNFLLDAGESCEDGNLVSGDGCDAGCRWEQMTGTLHTVEALAFGSHRLCEDCDRSGMLAPVGSHVAVGVAGEPRGSAQLFDVDTGDLLRLLEPPAPFGGFSFGQPLAAIGAKVLVGEPEAAVIHSGSGAAHLFDPETGVYLRTLISPTPQEDGGFGASVAGLGANALIAGVTEAAVYLFDGETGALLRTFLDLPPREPYSAYALGALGPDVLVGGTGVVHLLDGLTGTRRHIFGTGADPRFGRRLAVLDGDVLISGEGAVHRFDGSTGKLVRMYPGFESPLAAANGMVLLTGPGCFPSTGGAAYLLDAETGSTLDVFCGGFTDEPIVAGALVDDTMVLGQTGDHFPTFLSFAPCTNGILVPGEECDDGNQVSGDGCDRNCSVTRCGNGVLTTGEACDDGNRAPDDGCEPDCSLPRTITTTTTTLEAPATTTTTVAKVITPLPCATAGCDDGNPCTVDSCKADGCQHTGVTGTDALRCVLAGGTLAVPACTGQTLPGSVIRRLQQARTSLQRAEASVVSNRARRILAKAARNLRQAGKLAERAGRRGKLPPDCAAELQNIFGTARAPLRVPL